MPGCIGCLLWHFCGPCCRPPQQRLIGCRWLILNGPWTCWRSCTWKQSRSGGKSNRVVGVWAVALWVWQSCGSGGGGVSGWWCGDAQHVQGRLSDVESFIDAQHAVQGLHACCLLLPRQSWEVRWVLFLVGFMELFNLVADL
jgi:hypothetical protein